MGLFKQAEFARICGVEQAYLTMYRKRGKLVVREDGLIDDQNPTNAFFIKKLESKPKKEPKIKDEVVKETEVHVEHVADEPIKAEATKSKKPRNSPIPSGKHPDKAGERFDLDTEKKRLEIEKLQRLARQDEINHQKEMGKLIPIDPIRNVIMQTIKAYTMSYTQAAEKIVTEFGKRFRLNRNEMAELRAQLISGINSASESAITSSKREVTGIVKKYTSS